MSTTTISNSRYVSKRILTETIIIMSITLSSSFVSNVYLKYILEAPAFLYLLIEMRVRRRTPHELGFRISRIPGDLLENIPLLLLVTVILQITPLLIGKLFMPAYISHLRERMPSAILMFSPKSVVVLIITFLVTSFICLYEELIYRGFFLERLSWFTKPYAAIGISTIIFALMHFTPGNPYVTLFDLSGVLIDGFVYGIIYFKTKNIFASFIAHMLADWFGIIMFRLMF